MLKSMAHSAARAAFGAATLALASGRTRQRGVRVFYGGARGGAFGGPLVKIGMLEQRFQEHRADPSLLYQLSNSIYLPLFAMKALKRRAVPIVLNQNGVFYPAWFPKGWEQANRRMGEVHALATHVIYQSDFCRRCAERFLGPRTGSWEILFNAVDTARFSPSEQHRDRGPLIILLTGKIMPAVGYRVSSAVAGVAAARKGGLDAVLRIAGVIEPSVERQARALADELGVSAATEWLGPYSRAKAPDIYRDADIYLMTKHNDPCPNVVLEAMASGLPVVYSHSGGVPELVGEDAGVGLAVEESFEVNIAPSAEAIAEGVARAAGQRERMAAAARERAVRHFGITAWLDRHQALFERLVADARA